MSENKKIVGKYMEGSNAGDHEDRKITHMHGMLYKKETALN